MTVAELSEKVALPKQTVQRMVVELERLGAVQRVIPANRIALGSAMHRLAVNTLKSEQVSLITRPVLNQLVGVLEETCNIGVLANGEVVYVDRLECSWPLRVQFQPGSRVPIHCTAIGKLLLAYQPRSQRHRLITRQPLRRYTDQTITDPDKLDAQLAEIRAKGISVNQEEDCPGLMALAVPIRDQRGHVAAGLAVHAPVTRLTREHLDDVQPHLESAAQTLSQALFIESYTRSG